MRGGTFLFPTNLEIRSCIQEAQNTDMPVGIRPLGEADLLFQPVPPDTHYRIVQYDVFAA